MARGIGAIEVVAVHARLASIAIRGHVPKLVGGEASIIAEYVPHRIVEFSAGRAAARAALLAIGAPAAEVLQGPGGEPTWPRGLCGSISHTNDLAVALVAPLAAYRSVGVDVDDGASLGSAASTVASKREVRLLCSSGLARDEVDAYLLAFSMKEAVFKCQYPLTGRRQLGFQQVRLVADGPGTGAMRVAGWRVEPLVDGVLRGIRVFVHVLEGARAACACYVAGITTDV